MKNVNIATDTDNTMTYYVDVYGDIFDNISDAELFGIAVKVTVHGFFVGTTDEMEQHALDAYNNA